MGLMRWGRNTSIPGLIPPQEIAVTGVEMGLEVAALTEEFVLDKRGAIEDDQFSGLPTYAIEEASGVLLARLVLAQTVSDAQGPNDDYVRQCARAYLTMPHEDLRLWCGLGRVNAEFLVRIWRGRLGGVTPFPKNYRRLYKKDKKWRPANGQAV